VLSAPARLAVQPGSQYGSRPRAHRVPTSWRHSSRGRVLNTWRVMKRSQPAMMASGSLPNAAPYSA
jgi:hypothetical protein